MLNIRTLTALLFAGLIAFPFGSVAGDPQAEIDETLEHVDTVASEMAEHMAGLPEEQQEHVRAGFEQMIDDAAWSLEVETGASDSEIEEFRDEAEAIGREHGVMD